MSNIIGQRNNNTIIPLTAGSTMPAGTIISYSGSIAAFTSTASADSTTLIHKDGWAVCNGASIARASYADLYARVAATWNAATNPLTGSAQSAPADTATNFRIPNLQGTFLRGVGDFADNTKDTVLAGFKDYQVQDHTHGVAVGGSAGGANLAAANSFADITSGSQTYGSASTPAAYNTNSLVSGVVTGGGTETRPQNVGVYYLVKLYDNLAAADVYIAPASATVDGIVDRSAQTFAGVKTLANAPIFSSVTASQALVVDGSKSLSSLAYTAGATANTIVSRDSNGASAFSAVASGLTYTGSGTTASIGANATTTVFTTVNNATYFVRITGNTDQGFSAVFAIWDTAGGINVAKLGGHVSLSMEQEAANTARLKTTSGHSGQTYSYVTMRFA